MYHHPVSLVLTANNHHLIHHIMTQMMLANAEALRDGALKFIKSFATWQHMAASAGLFIVSSPIDVL